MPEMERNYILIPFFPEFWILTPGSLLYALCSMPYAFGTTDY